MLRDKQTNRFQHFILSPAERELAPPEHPSCPSLLHQEERGTFLLLCPNFSISNVCLQQRIPFLSEISGSKLTSELSEHNAFLKGEFFPLSERRESPTEHGGSSCSCLWQTPANSVTFRFLFLEPGARPHPFGFFGS